MQMELIFSFSHTFAYIFYVHRLSERELFIDTDSWEMIVNLLLFPCTMDTFIQRMVLLERSMAKIHLPLFLLLSEIFDPNNTNQRSYK